MKQYGYVLIIALWGGCACARDFRTQAYQGIATTSNNWGATLGSISQTLKGLPAHNRVHFEDLDHTVFSLQTQFNLVNDLEFVELVLALANIAHRNKSDCSGEMSKLWKLHPDAVLRAELARIMFYPTSAEHPLRGVASEVTRHRFIDVEWLLGNWWLVENITTKLYDKAPYAAKQITKRACLLKQVAEASAQLSAEQAAVYVAEYTERSEGLGMKTAFTYYIPYQYVLDNERTLAQQLEGPHLVTFVVDQPMLRFQTGSHHVVSHIGFLLSDGQRLLLRHADGDSVSDVPLADYLRAQASAKSWDNKLHGIQVIRIKPHSEQGRC